MKPTKNRFFCPEANRVKMKFDTEKKAENFIKFNGGEIDTNGQELRVYYCAACGGYHITKTKLSRFYMNLDKSLGSTSSDIQALEVYDRLKKKFKNKREAIKEVSGEDLEKEVKEKVIKKIKEANPIRFLELDKKALRIARHFYKKIPQENRSTEEKKKYIEEHIKTGLIKSYMMFLNDLGED